MIFRSRDEVFKSTSELTIKKPGDRFFLEITTCFDDNKIDPIQTHILLEFGDIKNILNEVLRLQKKH